MKKIALSLLMMTILLIFFLHTCAIKSNDRALNKLKTPVPLHQYPIPFGEINQPQDNITVKGTITFSGWALDDDEVLKVSFFYETETGLALLGDAEFVQNLRPDIQQRFPGYPFNNSAGWKYVLNTKEYPDYNYIIHAVAEDKEGNKKTLGTRRIVIENGIRAD